jgi:hypothetical protein
MNSRIKEAVAQVMRLYTIDPYGNGGPLHVQLDDGNLDLDIGMEPMYSVPERTTSSGFVIKESPDHWSSEIHEVCDRICELMTPMTLYHRKLVCRLAFRQMDQ